MSLNHKNLTKFKKISYKIFGFIFIFLGIIGVFLPLLPTTPFILLALACFINSSPKMYQKIINNKYFGKYIADYKEGKGISIEVKIFTISLLWLAISTSLFFFTKKIEISIILVLVAIAVSIHILWLKTKHKDDC